MDRRQGVDRFHFDDHLTLHEKIQAKSGVYTLLPERDRHRDLPLDANAETKEFQSQTLLVNGLQQAGAKLAMHRECDVHDGATDAIHLW